MAAASPQVDLQAVLSGNLSALIQQGIADNQRLAEHTLLAFQKDLFQGGQGADAALFAGLNTADRTPVIKTV